MISNANHYRREASSLVEMLVVVAIITLLLAITTPSLFGAIDTAKVATCQSNMHQMVVGYLTYADDNLGAIVYGMPDNRRADAFVKRGAGYDPIKQGALYRYIPNLDAWRCTADINGNERSYVPVATLNGEHWGNDHEQSHARRLSDLINYAQQIVWTEESDPRGWNQGSWMMYADAPHQWRWIDNVGRFHQGGTADSYSFADGHVEHWQWQDSNTVNASRNGQFFLYDPNNPDWLRIRRGYRAMATVGSVQYIR